MKKNIKFSVIASLILTSIGLLVNLICSLIFKFAPFTIAISGGEVIDHVGFGINFLEIFSNFSFVSKSKTEQQTSPIYLLSSNVKERAYLPSLFIMR